MRDKFENVRKASKLMSEADRLLGNGPWQYYLDQLLKAYDLLMDKYAPFRVGDKVQLREAPLIDDKHAPGWRGYEKLLRKGARGKVVEAECVDGRFRFGIVFDAERRKDPGQFTFVASELLPAPEPDFQLEPEYLPVKKAG